MLRNQIYEKIRKLFDSEDIGVINYEDLSSLQIGEWFYINDKKIRYKKIEHTINHLVFITEWMDESTFSKHLHENCDEQICVITGVLEDLIYKRTKISLGYMNFGAGVLHSVKGYKGTSIIVKFTKHENFKSGS